MGRGLGARCGRSGSVAQHGFGMYFPPRSGEGHQDLDELGGFLEIAPGQPGSSRALNTGLYAAKCSVCARREVIVTRRKY